jgi:hypothetical protein
MERGWKGFLVDNCIGIGWRRDGTSRSELVHTFPSLFHWFLLILHSVSPFLHLRPLHSILPVSCLFSAGTRHSYITYASRTNTSGRGTRCKAQNDRASPLPLPFDNVLFLQIILWFISVRVTVLQIQGKFLFFKTDFGLIFMRHRFTFFYSVYCAFF